MNSISNLSDSELLSRTKNLVAEEKRITREVLNHLEEIESRRLYLSLGFSSLYDYCTKELGYSESSGNRRISAMRLIVKIPEAKEMLKKDSVNLSTLSQLHSFLNKEEKEKTYTKEMKLDLLEKIENKSQDQCAREFVKISPETALIREKEKPLTEDLTQLTLVIPNDLKAKLKRLKDLTAHKNSNPTIVELFELSVDAALEKFDPTSAAAKRRVKNSENRKVSNGSRYIKKATRRDVWIRHQHCQYIDKVTKKKCQSTFALQIDHIHPFSLGGSNNPDNLRLLCRAHNQWRTKELSNGNWVKQKS